MQKMPISSKDTTHIWNKLKRMTRVLTYSVILPQKHDARK